MYGIMSSLFFSILPDRVSTSKLTTSFRLRMDSRKRELIRAQSPELKHLFRDVHCFQDGQAHCDVCGHIHPITRESCGIDWLLSGPSCKDISKLKSTRGEFLGCYQEGDEENEGAQENANQAEAGTSGPTYKYGFKKATGTAIIVCAYIYIYLYIYIFIYSIHIFA